MLFHLVGADARLFRVQILGWLLLEVLVTATQVFLPSLAASEALNTGASVLSFTAQILAIVLTVVIVQTHPLVGTDAFWMTRPIPRSTLLASKLTLLGTLMIGIPVGCDIAQMVIAHVPAGEMARVAAQTALLDALWLGVVMAGAAMTASLARFAALVGAAIATIAVWAAVNLVYLVAHPSNRPPTSAGPQIPDPTGEVTVVTMIVAAAAGLLLVQYRTRSRTRAGVTGVAGLAAAFAIGAMWPWPFLKPQVVVPDWARADSALRLSANTGTINFRDGIGWSANRRLWRTGRAKLWVGGVAPGWSPAVGLLDASIEVDGGGRLINAAGAYASAVSLEGTMEHPEQVVLRNVLNVQHLPAFDLTEGETATIFVVPETDFLRYASSKGTYHGRFRVNLTREEVAGALPLRSGAVFQDGAYRVEIEEAVIEPTGSLRLRARQSNARSWFDRRFSAVYAFYLRNEQTSEAVAGSAWSDGGQRLLGSVVFGGSNEWTGFDAHSVTIRFPWDPRPGQSFHFTRAWLDGAELAIVRLTRQGSVERELSFQLTPLPGPTGTGQSAVRSEPTK
jgi:hypothetical protein